jgi:tetratricopeptide (TPR) repeat protein
MSACGSAYVKDSLDDQIRLYTLCLTQGQVNGEQLAGAFLNRGVAYFRKGEVDRALADFGKSIQYDPYYGHAYLNRALIYLGRGEMELAEADLTASLRRRVSEPRDRAYAYRGLIRMSRGNCAGALDDFNQSLKWNRKLAWSHGAKAWILSTCADGQQRNGAEALKIAQTALALQDHWKFHDALAAAYSELGRFEDSVRELNLAQAMIRTTSPVLRGARACPHGWRYTKWVSLSNQWMTRSLPSGFPSSRLRAQNCDSFIDH